MGSCVVPLLVFLACPSWKRRQSSAWQMYSVEVERCQKLEFSLETGMLDKLLPTGLFSDTKAPVI